MKKYAGQSSMLVAVDCIIFGFDGDDGSVPVENSIRYYQACIKNNVPAEMHLYPKGGHGFGMNNKTTNDKWFDRLINWMNKIQ